MALMLIKMFEKTCRTCLTTNGEMVSIFSPDHYVNNLPKKLMAFTKVEISDDDSLPKVICKKCMFMADSFYCFKEQCESADNELKSIIFNNFKVSKENYTSGKENRRRTELETFNKQSRPDVKSNNDEGSHCAVEYISDDVRISVENAFKRRKSIERRINMEKVSESLKYLKGIEVVPLSEVVLEHGERSKVRNNREIDAFSVDKSQKINRKNNSDDSFGDSSPQFKLPPETGMPKIKDDDVANKSFVAYGKRKKLNFFTVRKIVKVDDPEVRVKPEEEIVDKDRSKQDYSIVKNDFDDSVIVTGDCRDARRSKTDFHKQNSISSETKFPKSDGTIEHELSKTSTVDARNADRRSNRKADERDAHAKRFADGSSLKSNLSPFSCKKCNLVCEHCKKELPSERSLRDHRRIHTGDRPYECPHCGKRFTQRCNLNAHVNRHLDDRRFVCSECGKGFNQRGTRDDHLVTHTGLRRHKCLECDASFTVASALKRHLWIHTDKDRPHNCNNCKLQFVGLYDLRRHMKVRHGELVGYENPRVRRVKRAGDEIEGDDYDESGAQGIAAESDTTAQITAKENDSSSCNVDQFEEAEVEETGTKMERLERVRSSVSRSSNSRTKV